MVHRPPAPLVTMAILALAAGCRTSPTTGDPGDVAAEGRSDHTLLVVNARLRGVDGADAVLVRGRRIAAVGPATTLRAEAGAAAEVIDAAGGAVLPGFHDAHIHLLSGGLGRAQASLEDARTMEQTLAAVAAWAAANPEAEWVTGRGWSYDIVPKGELPGRAALDAVVSDRPVALESYDGHAFWANSLALARAGIDAGTKDPAGGTIVREADGATPQGALLESAAALLERAVPAPSRAQKRAALAAAAAHLASLGLTAVHTFESDASVLELLDELAREDALPLRVTVSLPLSGDLDAYEALRRERAGREDGRVRLGGLKAFVDGVIESRTAFMLEPYAGAGADRGAPQIPPDELRARVTEAHRRGFFVSLHAIGDAGVRLALDAFEAARAAHPEVALPHRIEHIEVVHPDDLARFAALGVVASMQPYHAYPGEADPDAGAWSENLGAERLRRSFAWRDLRDAGARLAFGSDWPVMSAAPLRGLAVAVTRRSESGNPEGGWNAHQAITIDEAIAAYTRGAARSVGLGDALGALEPGALADLVILDPSVDLDRPATLWMDAGARATLVDGRRAHPR